MPTDKYDLHTIYYSVQGWDAIMATDMEKIDAMIPTRILGTLGETITVYQALYLKAADSKWYKARADGILQPCHGLAVEGGIAGGEIRIHRMGEIINTGWAWATIGGPIYLDPSTPGALTQTRPSINIQLIGYALSAIKMIVMVANVLSLGVVQPTPTAKTTAVALTIAELLTRIITGTHAAGATQAYTLPTGTLCEGGALFSVNDSFDWVLINLSAAAVDTITLTAGADHTIVGNPIIQSAHATTGGIWGNSATFRTRKTALNTFVTYRIS
jgi:hypothetical protein